MAAIIVRSNRKVEIKIVGDDQFYVVEGEKFVGPYRLTDGEFLIVRD